MEQIIKTIQKHNQKINRILIKISQKKPQLSQEIDLALYSCLKIEKVINKCYANKLIKNMEAKQEQKKNVQERYNDDKQWFENAVSMIEGFKMATKNLEKKVGILLREDEKIYQEKYGRQGNYYYETLPDEKSYKDKTNRQKKHGYLQNYQDNGGTNGMSFSPYTQLTKKYPENRYIQSGKKRDSKENSINRKYTKNKENIKSKKYQNQNQQSQDSIQQKDNYSKNISELDQQIIELASQIKHVMKIN